MCNYQRPLLAAGSLMWVTMILGCMSLCIGRCHDAVQPDGTICQKGETQVSSGDVQIVYYPVPYASPPNLEVENHFGKFTLLDQQASYFRVQYQGGPLADTLRWKARGVRCPTEPRGLVSGSGPYPPLPPPNPPEMTGHD